MKKAEDIRNSKSVSEIGQTDSDIDEMTMDKKKHRNPLNMILNQPFCDNGGDCFHPWVK